MHTHLDLVEVAQRAAVQMLVLMEVQETLVLAVRAAEEHLEAINLILVLQMSMLVLLVLVMLLVVAVVDFQLQVETITITGVLQEDLVALV
jgi:cell division septal protein FtsQ